MAMNFVTPKRYVHPYHILGLRSSGSGYYVCGSERMPDATPYVNFLPKGDDDLCGLVGPVEGWWTSFQWPGTRIRRDGSHFLILAFYVDLPEEQNLVGHRALAQFCKLLRERACAEVTLEDLAGEAGISPDHLRDLFRNRFGIPPVEYRTGLRMARAR